MLKSVHFATLFGVDSRALAAMRMALAALLLFDLGQRIIDLAAWCTDEGVMSVAAARDWAATPWRWSLHTLSGTMAWQATLFAVAGTFAVMLAIGYRTWLATCVSWAFLISLHARTPLVTTGGDLLLRMLLFWGMFLPLGARWSTDFVIRRRRSEGIPLLAPRACLSVATAAILVQVAIVYLFSAFHKWNDIWLGGSALERVFQYQLWSRPLGRVLLEYPTLLHGLTWATLGLELLGPILLFSPWRTDKVRTAVVVALALVHVFIELTMSVGLFSYVALAGLLLFLPSSVWDAIERYRECLPWRFANREATAHSTPRNATEGVPYRTRSAVCAFFLVYVVLWNVADPNLFGGRLRFLMPRPLWPIAHATSIDQHWTMFAEPPATDGWFAAHARLADGRTVDLLRNGDVASDERPPTPTGVYHNQRWQKLFANLLEPHLIDYRQGVAAYFARKWDRSHAPQERTMVLDLYYFEHRRDPQDGRSQVHRQRIARVELGSPEETDAFSELLDRLR